MKKAIALALALCLLTGLLALPASAADAADAGDAVAMVQALGIMNGDGSGNLNLSANVTRAEFCKMLVAASTYRDTVGGSTGYSLFSDVKSDHWAVEYIKVCVDNGWFVGYLDGTFRPNATITLEEAATVALRLLGYTSSDLAGSYPTAQLSKFEALGLHTGFSTGRGETMTRSDCAWLFYNLMAAETKDGQVYAQTLGYTLDATGHVDYSALVNSNTEGPFTVSGEISLPFSGSVTVYRNGALSSLSAAEEYDVYYYNANLRTVWIYSNRVTGTYTAASPSTAAPTAVTVAGVEYSIETSGAAYKLSTQGQYAVGDTVTLLLGMNGGVADVVDASVSSGRYCGVVTGSGTTMVTGADGTTTLRDVLQVMCTDGVERSFESSYRVGVGSAVVVDYGASRAVSRASRSLTGSFNASGTRVGDYALAENVEILDSNGDGGVMRIYPSRLAGVTLRSGDVLYYELNADDEVNRLILRDVTGDVDTYALVTSAVKNSNTLQISSSYTCLINGQSQVIAQEGTIYSANEGGAVITYDDSQVTNIRNLQQVELTSLSGTSAMASNRAYNVSEQVQVYLKDGTSYHLTTVSAVDDAGLYRLTGWYDNSGYTAGGQIRIIVAEER